MIFILRVYQVVILLITIFKFLKNKIFVSKDNQGNYLTLSKWLFYFGAIASFILSFGVIAEVEYMKEQSSWNMESIGLIVLFLVVVVFGAILAYTQAMWYIKYDETKIIFRNSFGFSKTYSSANLRIGYRKGMTQLFVDDIKITQWDSRLMNMWEELEFEQFIESKNKSIKSTNTRKKKKK